MLTPLGHRAPGALKIRRKSRGGLTHGTCVSPSMGAEAAIVSRGATVPITSALVFYLPTIGVSDVETIYNVEPSPPLSLQEGWRAVSPSGSRLVRGDQGAAGSLVAPLP